MIEIDQNEGEGLGAILHTFFLFVLVKTGFGEFNFVFSGGWIGGGFY